MTIQETEILIRSLYDLFNTHTTDPQWLDKIVASVSDDCDILDVPSGMMLAGKEGMQLFLSTWTTAFLDCTFSITNMVVTENQAVVEFIGRGTHTGTLYGPAGEIAPSGRNLVLRYCIVHRVQEKQVVELHIYYDAMGLFQQIGLINEEGIGGEEIE
jgi:ketosteroid isomerase-like protein